MALCDILQEEMRWIPLLLSLSLVASEAEIRQLYSDAVYAMREGRYCNAKETFLLLLNHPEKHCIPGNILYEITLELARAEIEMGQTMIAQGRLKHLHGFEPEMLVARSQIREGNEQKGWQSLCALKARFPLEQWPTKDRLFYLERSLLYTPDHVRTVDQQR